MKLEQATAIAEYVKEQLAPHCVRIEIAGSIRRRKPDVGDIEIVAIPKTKQRHACFSFADFGEYERCQEFIRAAYGIGRVLKGHPIDGKYIQFEHAAGINVDLFLATPENWGLIFAIRTGCADFSHWRLASGWVRNGYKSIEGTLTKDGVSVPVPEERDLFRLAGVDWVEPENRNQDDK